MISAMPAVAVRRERRKSKNRPMSASSSKHSSMSSLSSSRASSRQSRRTTTQSISTISTLPSSENQLGIPYYRYCRESQEEEQQRLQLIVYAGATLVVVGLVLAFIGFGLNMPSTKNIGLLIIGLGSILCFIRVFCTRQQTTLDKRPRFATTSTSGDSFYTLAHTSSNATTPSNGSLRFHPLPVRRLPLSPSQESTSTVTSFRSTSLTPTSLNSIPETQILITGESERY
ncbi:uncharacterized protein LOC111087763 [Limulus polyphemus]|uniref:Uncharacterized protein LOC111087763 n=1 Tax=Limulus polyphemus TaxID=6850 RepID=A0ABM1T5Y3_LIMPO|nr:uncharacterized protein LOC111087763 [Limulus polyphemus]